MPKKSKFQRIKEQREAEKRRAERETAELYASFAASFKSPSGNETSFVRGGIQNGPSEDANAKTREPYKFRRHHKGNGASQRHPSGSSSSVKPGISIFGGADDDDEEEEAPQPKKRKREMDVLLEELKRNQASGATNHVPIFDTPGSFDNGDPNTTNIYVGNLPPTVTEETLGEIFCEFGDIDSIKIMWPRTDEERARKRNCGFISFHTRSAAEDAKFNLQGSTIEGNEIRIEWGKAVRPSKGPPRYKKKRTKRSDNGAKRAANAPRALNHVPSSQIPHKSQITVKIEVKYPIELFERERIDLTAKYVAKDGQSFEKMIMNRERSNRNFSFLFDSQSQNHQFYRWRVWSLANGDSLLSWREEPYQMFRRGALYVPPKMEHDPHRVTLSKKYAQRTVRPSPAHSESKLATYLTGRAREREREKRERVLHKRLSIQEREELKCLLAKTSASRASVRDAMVFALDSAEASKDVVDVLVRSVVSTEDAPSLVARLYVISDILHNASASTVRHASSFHALLREHLPQVFERLSSTLRSLESRLTAFAMKERVLRVLNVWNDWELYEPLFLKHLEAAFVSERELSAVAAHDKDTSLVIRKGVEDSPVGDVDASRPHEEEVADEDLDGVPIDDDNNDDDDIDGVPIEGDIDGVPLDDSDLH